MISTNIVSRGYELDASRHIPPAVFIRYMEWGRWELLNDKNSAFFQSINSLVVATQSVSILNPIQERVSLQLKAWLSRVGRTSLDISQLLVDEASQKPIAMGKATLVNIGENHKPSPVSEKVRAFIEAAPDGYDGTGFLSVDSEEAPSDATTMNRTVMASDIDLLQHVNHSKYVDYIEDARKHLSYEQEELKRMSRSLTVQYINEALHRDELAIQVWRQPNGTYQFKINRGHGVVARAASSCE